MSIWDDISKPIDKALNSNAFKAVFPVQALAQGATKLATNLDPSEQYAAGAAGGSLIAGGSALAGGSGAGGMTPYMPTSAPNMGAAGSTLGAGGSSSPLSLGGYGSSEGAGAPVVSPWEAHAPLVRHASMPMAPGGSGYDSPSRNTPQPNMQLPQRPVMKKSKPLPYPGTNPI